MSPGVLFGWVILGTYPQPMPASQHDISRRHRFPFAERRHAVSKYQRGLFVPFTNIRCATVDVSFLQQRSCHCFQRVSFVALTTLPRRFSDTQCDPLSSAPPSRSSFLRPAALGTGRDGSLMQRGARPTSLRPQLGLCVGTCSHMHVVRKSNLLRTISTTEQEEVMVHRTVWFTAELTTSHLVPGDFLDFGSARFPLASTETTHEPSPRHTAAF